MSKNFILCLYTIPLLISLPNYANSMIVKRFLKGKNCGVTQPIRYLDIFHLPPGMGSLAGVTCAWVTMYDWQPYLPPDTQCRTGPSVLTSTDLSPQFPGANILSDGSCDLRNDTLGLSNYWLAPAGVLGADIVIDLGCERLVSQLTLRNCYNWQSDDSATNMFSVWISANQTDWQVLVNNQTLPDERNLTCPQPLHGFPINGYGRYVRFVAETFWGVGAGLQYLSID